MANPRRLLDVAGKAVPALVLGGLGLALAGNIAENAYRRFIQTPEQLAQQIRERERRPNVFLDLRSGKRELGRVEIELDYDNTPLTSENFRALCTHESGIGYRGSIFHRIVPGFLCQGGDIDHMDGTGGLSIYGKTFADESFDGIRHDRAGVVGMANKGPDTNNSQFYIFTSSRPAPWLDGKHVAFGRVVKGMEVVHAMEAERAEEGSALQKELRQKAAAGASAAAAEGEGEGDGAGDAPHPAPTVLSSFLVVDCGEVETAAAAAAAAAAAEGQEGGREAAKAVDRDGGE